MPTGYRIIAFARRRAIVLLRHIGKFEKFGFVNYSHDTVPVSKKICINVRRQVEYLYYITIFEKYAEILSFFSIESVNIQGTNTQVASQTVVLHSHFPKIWSFYTYNVMLPQRAPSLGHRRDPIYDCKLQVKIHNLEV